MIKKNCLIFIPANDFNEEEFLSVKNSFQKKGIQIFITSDSGSLCIGDKGLRVKADINFFNIHPGNFKAIVLIGGSGTRNYWNNSVLQGIVKKFSESNKIIGAICSSPVLLGLAGLLRDINATCYPNDKNELIKTGAVFVDEPVVKSGNIITAQSPKDSSEFSQILLKTICS